MHARVPYSDACADLFTAEYASGSREACSLPYVRNEGNEVLPDVDKIKNPWNFLRALQDFVRERIASDVLFSGFGNERSPAWENHIQLSQKELIHAYRKYKHISNGKKKGEILLGTATEHIMSGTIREFIKDFDGNEGNLHLPEWENNDKGIESGIELGDSYRLRSRFPHNALLDERRENGMWKCIRELDMIALIGDDTFFSLDVTCSGRKIEKLLKHRSCENPIMRFGNAMHKLYEESSGDSGYAHVAQIHVHCCDKGYNPHDQQTILKIDEGNISDRGVFLIRLPLLEHVIDIKEKTEKALKTS